MENLNETIINIILGVLVLVALVANIYFKKRKSEKTPIGKVVVMVMDLDSNYKMLENFGYSQNVRKFKSGCWKKNRGQLEFLPLELRDQVDITFEKIEEVNDRISAAKNFSSSSYLAGIDVSKLAEPIDQARNTLREWAQENMNNPEFAPKKRRGLFG
ncbi:hypothetical protein ACFLV2_00650 [Chloroflexota bacterium]